MALTFAVFRGAWKEREEHQSAT